ncbi:MAG: IS30 family transposase [Spirochaetales bacterium]|nr:IS30 family transposase [Spirochaetales bacterium]
MLQYHYSGTNKYKKITSPTLLAAILSKSERTIRRELIRGVVEHVTSELVPIIEYNADFAQNDAESKASAKGPPLKLGKDWALVQAVSTLIKANHYSPYAVLQHFARTQWPSDTRICEKTLYNYIAAGDIPVVTEKDLLCQGKRRNPRGRPKKHAHAMNASRTIDKRPAEAHERSVAGHWEMDTIYSGKECSPSCLLTLTERKTRTEIARKIPDRTASSVTSEIDKMERQMGSVSFRKLFLSITPDNGSEFSNILGLEQSVLCNTQRTQVFFAHPYSSFERGTNENHNGIIRRFIPKGSDIGKEKMSSVRNIQDWMNIYPRKILQGKAPLEVLINELGDDFHLPDFLEVK